MVFNLMIPATVEEIKHEITAATQTMTPEMIYTECGTSSSNNVDITRVFGGCHIEHL